MHTTVTTLPGDFRPMYPAQSIRFEKGNKVGRLFLNQNIEEYGVVEGP